MCPFCTNGTHATTNSTEDTFTTLPIAITPLPERKSTHVTPEDHTNSTSTTRPHPSSYTSDVSMNSTAVITSFAQSTVSPETTQSPEATNSTTRHSVNGTAGISTPTVSATTSKGGSSPLFRSCSQLLVPVISILIYSA